ncbi:MAG: ribonuclease H-like domain-containing protein [Thermodesulfobacteriota bacterium]
MLRHTLCHIPGIGAKTERNLWHRGIESWDDILKGADIKSRRVSVEFARRKIEESIQHLESHHPLYFHKALPPSERWRIFADFRDSVAYLDIETNGLGGPMCHITTIALFDGKDVYHYVYRENLEDFKEDVARFQVIVTYNGKCFDVPVLEQYFGIRMPQAHIDLRFLLRSLGYKGGLKGCEKMLGLDRQELDGMDGYFAVLLWNDYLERGDRRALDTLLAYNVLDAVNLEKLMVIAYNLKVKDTPFYLSEHLSLPPEVENPFKPHMGTVKRIMDEVHWYRS